MPEHTYVRKDTYDSDDEVRVTVYRVLGDHATPPTEEEYPTATKYKWVKVFDDTKQQVKGFGMKGNWKYS